jgi:transcriptional regulator with XRE-family HTH domain
MNGGHLVREARRRAGLSQAALAERVGTTQSAIARVERGGHSPTLEYLERLVRACGFTLDVRLVPFDDHDWTLATQNLRLSPQERLDKMLATANLLGEASRSDSED